MSRRTPLLLGLLLTASLLVGGCGGAPPPAPPARSTWQGLFDSTLKALATQEYAPLVELLTPPGREGLERDLALLRKQLSDPLEGPRMLQKVRTRWADLTAADIDRARSGTVADTYRFWRRATTPREPAKQGGVRIDPAKPDMVDVVYRYGTNGPELPIRFVRIQGRWSVDEIRLGSQLPPPDEPPPAGGH